TLSQVTFESGLGSSCSQPLLACRPSRIVGSGWKTISMPAAGGVDEGAAAGPAGAAGPGVANIDVLATNPSCNAWRQKSSKFVNALPSASCSVHVVFVLPPNARVQ